MNTEDQNTNDASDTEPTVEADASEVLTKLLAVMCEQEARINRQDDLLIATQREISLLGQPSPATRGSSRSTSPNRTNGTGTGTSR